MTGRFICFRSLRLCVLLMALGVSPEISASTGCRGLFDLSKLFEIKPVQPRPRFSLGEFKASIPSFGYAGLWPETIFQSEWIDSKDKLRLLQNAPESERYEAYQFVAKCFHKLAPTHVPLWSFLELVPLDSKHYKEIFISSAHYRSETLVGSYRYIFEALNVLNMTSADKADVLIAILENSGLLYLPRRDRTTLEDEIKGSMLALPEMGLDQVDMIRIFEVAKGLSNSVFDSPKLHSIVFEKSLSRSSGPDRLRFLRQWAAFDWRNVLKFLPVSKLSPQDQVTVFHECISNVVELDRALDYSHVMKWRAGEADMIGTDARFVESVITELNLPDDLAIELNLLVFKSFPESFRFFPTAGLKRSDLWFVDFAEAVKNLILRPIRNSPLRFREVLARVSTLSTRERLRSVSLLKQLFSPQESFFRLELLIKNVLEMESEDFQIKHLMLMFLPLAKSDIAKGGLEFSDNDQRIQVALRLLRKSERHLNEYISHLGFNAEELLKLPNYLFHRVVQLSPDMPLLDSVITSQAELFARILNFFRFLSIPLLQRQHQLYNLVHSLSVGLGESYYETKMFWQPILALVHTFPTHVQADILRDLIRRHPILAFGAGPRFRSNLKYDRRPVGLSEFAQEPELVPYFQYIVMALTDFLSLHNLETKERHIYYNGLLQWILSPEFRLSATPKTLNSVRLILAGTSFSPGEIYQLYRAKSTPLPPQVREIILSWVTTHCSQEADPRGFLLTLKRDGHLNQTEFVRRVFDLNKNNLPERTILKNQNDHTQDDRLTKYRISQDPIGALETISGIKLDSNSIDLLQSQLMLIAKEGYFGIDSRVVSVLFDRVQRCDIVLGLLAEFLKLSIRRQNFRIRSSLELLLEFSGLPRSLLSHAHKEEDLELLYELTLGVQANLNQPAFSELPIHEDMFRDQKLFRETLRIMGELRELKRQLGNSWVAWRRMRDQIRIPEVSEINLPKLSDSLKSLRAAEVLAQKMLAQKMLITFKDPDRRKAAEFFDSHAHFALYARNEATIMALNEAAEEKADLMSWPPFRSWAKDLIAGLRRNGLEVAPADRARLFRALLVGSPTWQMETFWRFWQIQSIEAIQKEIEKLTSDFGLSANIHHLVWDRVRRRDVGLRLFEEAVSLAPAQWAGVQNSFDLLTLVTGLPREIGKSTSESSVATVYELALEIQKGLSYPAFASLSFENTFFKDRRLSSFIEILTEMRNLKVLLGSTSKAWERVLAIMGINRITSESASIISRIKTAIEAELKNTIAESLMGLPVDFTYEQFARLSEQWGDIEPIKVLVNRFGEKGDSTALKELPVMARIFELALKGQFEEYKFKGDPQSADDQTRARKQLESLRSLDQFAAWTRNRATVSLYSPQSVDLSELERQRIKNFHAIVQTNLLPHVGGKLVDTERVAVWSRELALGNGPLDQLLALIARQENLFASDARAEARARDIFSLVANSLLYMNSVTGLRRSIDLLQLLGEKFPGAIQVSDREQVSADLKALKQSLGGIETIFNGNVIVLSVLNHDPKFLLTIGDLVNISSCQNFRTGTVIRTLPGYVIDANVQGMAGFVINQKHFYEEADFNFISRALSSGQKVFVEFDGNRRVAVFRYNARVIATRFLGYAYLRHIVKLGSTPSGKPGVYLERAYSQIHPAVAQLHSGVDALLRQVAFEIDADPSGPVTIEASRNPNGHYSDERGGAMTSSYTVHR